MTKQELHPAHGDLRARWTERAVHLGTAVCEIVQRLAPGDRGANKVQIRPHESEVVPGEILWEDWRVDPSAIEATAAGTLRIRGYEDRDLWRAPFAPLPVDIVDTAKEQGLYLHFRAHPTASGLFFVEVAA